MRSWFTLKSVAVGRNQQDVFKARVCLHRVCTLPKDYFLFIFFPKLLHLPSSCDGLRVCIDLVFGAYLWCRLLQQVWSKAGRGSWVWTARRICSCEDERRRLLANAWLDTQARRKGSSAGTRQIDYNVSSQPKILIFCRHTAIDVVHASRWAWHHYDNRLLFFLFFSEGILG